MNTYTKLSEIIYSWWTPRRKILHVNIATFKGNHGNTTIIYTRICGLPFTSGVTEPTKYVLNINCNDNLSLGRQHTQIQPNLVLYTHKPKSYPGNYTERPQWITLSVLFMYVGIETWAPVSTIKYSNNCVTYDKKPTLVQKHVLWLLHTAIQKCSFH